MALSYIRFTELDAVSSVAPDDIAPVVETITNINKKITIGNLNNSLAVTADVSVLKAASGNWQSTYNNVQSNYNNWNSVYSSIQSTSGSWNTASTYATVYATNSGEYESTYTSLVANSAIYDNAARYPGWDSNYNTTNANSARWSSVYSAYNAVSSTGFNPFVGAGIASNGTQGLVPAPQGGEDNANLAGDGTFHLNVWDQAQAPGSYDAQTSYYQPFMMQRSTRDGGMIASYIFLVPFRITQTLSVSAIRLYNNQVASAAGTTAKLAIYKWRTQYGKPRVTDLVSSQFGTLDLTQTGGLMSYATNPVTLPRGLYFVAFTTSGTTGTMSRFRDDTFHAQLFSTVPYSNAWPGQSFPCTPVIDMSPLGLTYAALWPSSLSVNSSSIYNITVVDYATPILFLIGTP